MLGLAGGLLLLQRQMLAWQLLRELTVHILAEEAVLYPVVAEQVGCWPLKGRGWGIPRGLQSGSVGFGCCATVEPSEASGSAALRASGTWVSDSLKRVTSAS